MRLTFRLVLSVIVCVFASAPRSSAGMDANILAQQICRNFTGIFRWDAPSLPQLVTMQVRQAEVTTNGVVVLQGIGR